MTVGHAASKGYASVFELARSVNSVQAAALHRIFEFSVGHPRCRATPQLREKYGVKEDNSQSVLRISNKVTLAQCWFNEERTRKPQTFAAAASEASAFDPTAGGTKGCDFCSYPQLTAEGTWGRAEGPYAISASNLFKYVQPAQGVILFKHHDPLRFNLEQLQDLVNVSADWFDRAAAEAASADAAIGLPPRALHPLWVWNCLPRGGASQFHGHAQVMISDAPFPAQRHEAEAVLEYDLCGGTMSRGYYQDVLAAHDEVGLLVRDGAEGDCAFAFASLAPWKDMEVCVHGSSLRSAAFQRLLFTALRALVDELGVATFNAAIHNIPLPPPAAPSEAGSAGTRSASSGSVAASAASSASGFLAASPRGAPLPVVARIVSRGKLSSAASDFGGLEVFGGASIGHTDPFKVAAALRAVHATLPPARPAVPAA
ncbi:hypothetical protein C2E20_0078 [Micractinium conductrix]|uniref:Galactose-1-phosphate uridylyltransferase n=1 Tax=Micractinium conductrix TaxID=554055 RepID=A0A2P6VQ14_9CHLO|nr:hypothetical protein C2E20_0078 [Micractinium conductrix]|eukprot:PSC76196.1 hypothetical protein C2E20_0078 [Micractinium conductrix]